MLATGGRLFHSLSLSLAGLRQEKKTLTALPRRRTTVGGRDGVLEVLAAGLALLGLHGTEATDEGHLGNVTLGNGGGGESLRAVHIQKRH